MIRFSIAEVSACTGAAGVDLMEGATAFRARVANDGAASVSLVATPGFPLDASVRGSGFAGATSLLRRPRAIRRQKEGRWGGVARFRGPRSPGRALPRTLAVSFEGGDVLAGAGSPEEDEAEAEGKSEDEVKGETGASRLLARAFA
jgi:hypothetical protein